ncbi:Hypothetical protein SCF082_LOCUS14295 [Durusdinium trenchii]|uniref:Fe2OG dioxygenase domain-containing protein n=1 Tax=Durusdinium trenchii TaxID=1381693 RepID=A0ABP0JWS2_9DINO
MWKNGHWDSPQKSSRLYLTLNFFTLQLLLNTWKTEAASALRLETRPREIEWSQVGSHHVEEIRLIHDLWHHPSVEEIKDRKKTLQYRHIAYRMELPLRAHGQHLYAKLIDTMAWADAFLWQKLPRNEFAYPEAAKQLEEITQIVEYIVYEGKEGLPGSIEPHVDNHSAVTIVVLLSDPSEFGASEWAPAGFKGGVNCFASPDSEDLPARVVSLDVGDAVLFRGEKLRHWITPVTEGRRVILQIELSRV